MSRTRSLFTLVVAGLALFTAPATAAVHRAEARVAAAAPATTDPVNINTAGVKELMALDGIGKKVAEKIVEYRDAHGPFKQPRDVRKVDGVGGGLWERNKERIVVK